MGVSGTGKTTIGTNLSNKLGCPFYDADDYHPQANINKMAHGHPLTDEDRWPWLERLHQLISNHLNNNQSLILACSALKQSYRNYLQKNHETQTTFIHLQGSFDLIHKRMQQRPGHYMKADMLKSQFDTLELPEHAITISIDQTPQAMIDEIMTKLHTPH